MNWAMNEKNYSQRRACELVGIDPRVYRYRSSRADDADLRHRMRELASERRRFGYRRLHILLKREGVEVNWKKLYRLYKEERLTVRKRGGRKRALGTRAPMAIPQGPNQRWSLDFVSSSLSPRVSIIDYFGFDFYISTLCPYDTTCAKKTTVLGPSSMSSPDSPLS